ncbi:MAG TPA: hypothetical protein VF937_08250, partial [Chloroflexota bacterium]
TVGGTVGGTVGVTVTCGTRESSLIAAALHGYGQSAVLGQRDGYCGGSCAASVTAHVTPHVTVPGTISASVADAGSGMSTFHGG